MGNVKLGTSDSNTKKGGVSRTLVRAKNYRYVVYVANWWDGKGTLHREKFSCGNVLRLKPQTEKLIEAEVVKFRKRFESRLKSGRGFDGHAEVGKVKTRIAEILKDVAEGRCVNSG